jgi:hypothetical protein
VAKVKSDLESKGLTVSRTGYYDIEPLESYDKQQPLSARLAKLYPDLKARNEEHKFYVEVKQAKLYHFCASSYPIK